MSDNSPPSHYIEQSFVDVIPNNTSEQSVYGVMNELYILMNHIRKHKNGKKS